MSYPRNAASPKPICVGSVVLTADGTVQTSDCFARVSLDGGAWGAGGGSLAYDATSGVVTYAPIQAEVNGDVLMIGVYKANCLGCSATVLMDLQTADNNTILASATYGLSALKTLLDTTGIKVLSIADDAITAAATKADAVTKIQAGLAAAAKLLAYVQLLARKDAAIATDNATELAEINANGGTGAGAYANTTEAQEAIRDKLPANLEDLAITDTTGWVKATDQDGNPLAGRKSRPPGL